MAHQTRVRSAIYNALKANGWTPPKKFVQMPLAELEAELARFQEEHGPIDVPEPVEPAPTPRPTPPAPPSAPLAELAAELERVQNEPAAPPLQAQADPDEMPGQRQSEQFLPIRTDDQGRIWFQEEVLKPAFPKPRGRRVLRYEDTGVEKTTVQAGEYSETFEVAGTGPTKASEIKITLPSYQVGIYKDPRFPFVIHTYNGNEGFDFEEVEGFFGGPELVPAACKRKYVENHLCYDIRTVIRAIEAEHRQNQLIGKA